MSTEPDLIKPRFMSLHYKTKMLKFIFGIRYQLSGHTVNKKCNGFMLDNEEADATYDNARYLVSPLKQLSW